MCVQYHIVGGVLDRRFRFFFFVRNDFFLKLVDEHQNGGVQHVTPPRLLFWQEWGVDNTRFMPYGMQPRWLRLVPRFMSSQVVGFLDALGARTPANQTRTLPLWQVRPRVKGRVSTVSVRPEQVGMCSGCV